MKHSIASRFGSGALLHAALLVLIAAQPVLAAPNELFDVSSGGRPTISGNLGGGVLVADPTLLGDLNVTVDFGEVSPINRNGIVKVVVPIAIRAESPFELFASVSASGAPQPLQMQLSDIGFGLQNIRIMSKGKNCANTSINAAYANDPATTVTMNPRARYPSSLANLTATSMVLSGPEVSPGKVKPRKPENGILVDAVFALVPQFFLPGTTSVTITFSMRPGPANMKCT